MTPDDPQPVDDGQLLPDSEFDDAAGWFGPELETGP